MSSVAVPCLAGAHADLVEVLVDEAIQRVPLLVDLVDSALQLVPVALEAAAEASLVASPVAEVDVVGLAAIAEADSGVDLEVVVEAVVAVALAVVEEESAISPMATVHPTALLLGLVVPEEEAAVDSEVVIEAMAETVGEERVLMTGEAAEAATAIEAQAEQTTSPSEAEIDIATEMVGMEEEAGTTARGNVGMRATATTIRDNEGDTSPLPRLGCLLLGFVKGYLPFLRLTLFPSTRVRSSLFDS
jgi:hypothetical protein